MSRVFGANPRPRVLLENIPAELHPPFQDRFPTVRAVAARSEVDQSEFDVLITTATVINAESHLFVIVFGEPAGFLNFLEIAGRGEAQSFIQWSGTSRAREFHVPAGLPPHVQTFVQRRLIPIVTSKSENPILTDWSGKPGAVTPFLTTARGEVLAGRIQRTSGVECWAFPAEAIVHAPESLSVALELWRLQDPVRFPDPTHYWAGQPRWQTETERSLIARLDQLRASREDMLQRFRAEETALEASLRDARQSGDANERRLVTAQGDELVRAVQAALVELGFAVKYMDDVWMPGDRREDLRLSFEADRSWTNITEVRGYAKGAELNDLLRIARFRTRYLQDEGNLPSSSWYIANEFIGRDPDTRPQILRSNDKEVETFGEDGGLIVGTVTIFDMLMDLRQARVTQEELQRLLREGRGRLSYQRHRDLP